MKTALTVAGCVLMLAGISLLMVVCYRVCGLNATMYVGGALMCVSAIFLFFKAGWDGNL